jgi:threonine aldolase
MLSYDEHGKFRAQTQVSRRDFKSRDVPQVSRRDCPVFAGSPPPAAASVRLAIARRHDSGSRDWRERNGPPTLARANSKQNPKKILMNFASDNTAPMAPAILDAIVKANAGYALGYGNDDWTHGVERRLSEIFEREVAAFLVPTGTAANALALAQIAPPWGVVFCHAESHIATDECGAPEFFGGGFKLAGLPGAGARIAPETLQTALAGYGDHSPHQMVASALSITQATEAGTIYRTDEIAALCDAAKQRGLAVHMDGARFANALVRLNATPAQMTWRSGIDVLSFGATKGGALAAEAVVFFDPERARFLGERRKRGGQLLSKHRFIAAQFAAYLDGDLWLRLARHANAKADRLAQQLTALGLEPLWPVEANIVFVTLPRVLDAKLKAAGASYYVRSSESAGLPSDRVLARLVTSFATQDEDIDRFVRLCGMT